MLREMAWHFGTRMGCYFCGEPLLQAVGLEFGERNFPPVKTKLAIHHINENHDDNRETNLAPAHSTCHRRHHLKQQHAKANGKRIGAAA